MPHTFLGSYAGSWFEVTTPDQAALLSDAQAVRQLEPFMGRTLGVAEAARQANVTTEGMMYRVKQFEKTGLLSRQGEERRKGRAIKLYTAPAAIQVPFHLTPFDDLKAQLAYHGRVFEELRVRASARALLSAENRGRLLYRCDDTGAVHSETDMADPTSRARRIGGDFVGTLWLPDEVAKRIHHQVDELLSTLTTYSHPQAGTRPYLLSGVLLALDPEEDAKWLGPPG